MSKVNKVEMTTKLSHVIKEAAIIQYRVLNWTVETDSDVDYLRQDIENLRDDVADLLLEF